MNSSILNKIVTITILITGCALNRVAEEKTSKASKKSFEESIARLEKQIVQYDFKSSDVIDTLKVAAFSDSSNLTVYQLDETFKVGFFKNLFCYEDIIECNYDFWVKELNEEYVIFLSHWSDNSKYHILGNYVNFTPLIKVYDQRTGFKVKEIRIERPNHSYIDEYLNYGVQVEYFTFQSDSVMSCITNETKKYLNYILEKKSNDLKSLKELYRLCIQNQDCQVKSYLGKIDSLPEMKVLANVLIDN